MKHAALPWLLLAIEAVGVAFGRSTAAENGQLSLQMVAPRTDSAGEEAPGSGGSYPGVVVDPFAHQSSLLDELDGNYKDPEAASAPPQAPTPTRHQEPASVQGRQASTRAQLQQQQRQLPQQQQQRGQNKNWLQRAQADMQNLMGAVQPKPIVPVSADEALRQGSFADATGGVVAAIASARSDGQRRHVPTGSSTQGTGNPFDAISSEAGPASFSDFHMVMPGGETAMPSSNAASSDTPAAFNGGNSMQMAAPSGTSGFLASATPPVPRVASQARSYSMPQLTGEPRRSMLQRAREEEEAGASASSAKEAAGIVGLTGMRLPSAFSQSFSAGFARQESPRSGTWPWQPGPSSNSGGSSRRTSIGSSTPQMMQSQGAMPPQGMQRMDRLLQPLAFGQMQNQAQAQAEAEARMRRQAEQQREQQARAQAFAQSLAAVSNMPQQPSMAQNMMMQNAPEPEGFSGGGGIPGMAQPMMQPMAQPMAQQMPQPSAQLAFNSMPQQPNMPQPFAAPMPQPPAPGPSSANWWPAPQQPMQPPPQSMQQLPSAQLQGFLEAPTAAPGSWAGPSLLGLLGAQPVFAAETDPPRVSPFMVVPDVASNGGDTMGSSAASESFFGQQSQTFTQPSPFYQPQQQQQQQQAFLQQPQGFLQQPQQQFLQQPQQQFLQQPQQQMFGQQPQGDGGCVLCKSQAAQQDGGRWANYFSRNGDRERNERIEGDSV